MNSEANSTDSHDQEAQEIDAGTVANYLIQHADFFEQHPDVLAEITLSHQCDGAISLMERQVSALRDQHQKSKQQLQNLITIARDNDKLTERMHRLTLALMDADSLNDIQIALDDSLRGEFQADAVNIKLFIDPDEIALKEDDVLVQTILMPINDPQLDDFRTILSNEKPVCGTLSPEQLKYMFNEEAENINSTAIVPLGGQSCSHTECTYLGILTIGSYDPDRYHNNMGTLFLTNLGDIVSRAINMHLINKKQDD